MAVYSVWTTVCNYITAQFSKMVACKDEPVKCNRDLISLYQALFLFLVQFAVFVQFIYYERRTFRMQKVEASEENAGTDVPQLTLLEKCAGSEAGAITKKQITSHTVQFMCFLIFFAATLPAMIVPGYRYGSCHQGY